MKRLCWGMFLVVAMAVVAIGCDSSDGDSDADVVQTPDVASDPGTPDPGTDPGTPDPGTDPGVYDPGVVDPGTSDPGVTQDPGTPSCPSVPFGGAACYQIAACEMGCFGDGDFLDACVDLGDEDGQAKFETLRTCLDGAECETFFAGEEPSECAETSCADEMANCMPEGAETCRDIWTCRKDCDAEDPGCPAQCYALGTATERETWRLYQRCIFQGECASSDILANGWPTETCEKFIQNNSCANQAQACFPPL